MQTAGAARPESEEPILIRNSSLKTRSLVWPTLWLMAFAAVPSSIAAEDVSGSAPPAAASDPASERAEDGVATDAVSADSPVATIEHFHAGLIEIMKQADELGFQGRVDALRPLMDRTFDLGFMASKTVGGHWRKLSPEDKARWSDLFAQFSTANYAGRFTGFKGEQFLTLGVEEAARDTRMVLTRIVVPDDKDVELNYRLLKTPEGEWKVIDVYLDGTVSELALRRSEYASALKRQGFEELVAAVQTKIESLKAKGQAEG